MYKSNCDDDISKALLRNTTRIDYKELHNSGKRVPKKIKNPAEDSSLDPNKTMSEDRSGLLDVMEDDISDYIDENPIDGNSLTIEDIDVCVSKVENLRTQYRNTVRDLRGTLSSEEYKEKYEVRSKEIINQMKEYILKAKDRRKEIRRGEEERNQTEQDVKKEKDRVLSKQAIFLINDFHRVADEMIIEFSKDKENVSDEEILRRKESLSENLLNVDKLSNKLQKVLQNSLEKRQKLIKLRRHIKQSLKQRRYIHSTYKMN